MNLAKLREAEERFFAMYPGGFSNPLMKEIAKKHKVEKMNKLAQEGLAPDKFADPTEMVETMVKIASQSSLVSVFEKPKFRDLIKSLNSDQKKRLSSALYEFLHGDQRAGFEEMTDILAEGSIAKWPLLTINGVYYNPSVEVLVKPTTAKGVIQYFELDCQKYSPRPTFEFYQSYRDCINRIKKEVEPSLGLDNAAFCGFLMISMAEPSL